MSQLIFIIAIGISFALGHIVSSGKWKTQYQHEQVHNESLRILLDEVVEKERSARIVVDVLKVEIKYLQDEIEFLKEDN